MITKQATLAAPGTNEYSKYFGRYVRNVAEGDIIETLQRQGKEICRLISQLDEEAAEHAYQPGKWTIKQVAGHLADADRIFAYRALRIARGDVTPLSGFDENLYVAAARFNDYPVDFHEENLATARHSSLMLFQSFSDEESRRMGTASGFPISVRALAYVIAGHERHHIDFIRTRYLALN